MHDYFDRYVGSPYNNIEERPVLKWTNKMLSPREAVPIFLVPLQESNLCKTTPRTIQHSFTFGVDRTHPKHEDDIKSDDMGAWRNNGLHKYRFVMDEEGDLYQLD